MKNYITIVLLIFCISSKAQQLSLIDSIDLYNGKRLTKGSQTIKLPYPNFERALELSRRVHNKEGEFEALINLGARASDEGYHEKALIIYQQAYSITEDLDDPRHESIVLGAIGAVHTELEHYEMAIHHFKLAGEIFAQQNDTLRLGIMLSNMAGPFLRLEKGDSAMICLNQALDIFEVLDNQEGVVYALNNMGVYYLEKEQFENALAKFSNILKYDIIETDLKMKGTTYMNLGSSFTGLKNYKAAENHYLKALKIHRDNSYRNKEFIVYDGLAYLYDEMGDHKKAFEYQEKHYLLKDSILGAENQARIAELEMQYNVVAKEKALLESKEKLFSLEEKQRSARFRSTIIILSLFALLMFGVYLIRRLRQKKQQLALENKQITSDLDLFREKLQLIEGELETKNQDLTDFALDIARKNEIAAKLVAALNKVEKHLNTGKNKDFKALKSLVTSHNQVNEDIGVFQENIKTINRDFFKSLKTAYPSLTNNELQLCGLIRLNLSIKDIATMRNVAPKSIEMSRYRLRKKFGLQKGKDLVEFLINLSTAASG